MHKTIIGDVEITSDGETVWVNDKDGCIARFGPKGFEVGGSIVIPFGQTTEIGWRRFARRVDLFCGITIPDSHKPKFLAAAEVE